MPDRQREGPGRPRDPGADTAILRAAIDLLIERGVEATSIERIASRAGVAKVTVYRRWRTKEELLADAIEAVRVEIPEVGQSGESSSLTDAVEDLLPRWGEILADPRYRVLSARLLGAGPSYPALLDAYRRHHLLPRRRRSRAALTQAQADGGLPRDVDIDIVLDMMVGAVVYHLLLEPGPSDPEELTEYLRRVLRQAGLRLSGQDGDEMSHDRDR